MKGRQKGFTLIELLVVIGIIGILASIVAVSLNSSRSKARDAKRVRDIAQIKTAVEAYFADNGYYPPSPCGYDCNGYYTSGDSSWTTFQTILSPYLSALPSDPKNTGLFPWSVNEYTYTYGNVGRYTYTHQYDLTTKFETANILNCAAKGYHFFFNNTLYWCTYSDDLYEASQQ